MELEAKVPLVYRSDDQLTRPLNLGAGRDELFNSTGQGIGDVEATARYQFNDTSVDKPFVIGLCASRAARARIRSRHWTETTQAPELITNRIETELPTGSGFTHSTRADRPLPDRPCSLLRRIELSVAQPLAPGVTANTTQGQIVVGDVDPGDVSDSTSAWVWRSNEKSSFSLGYDGASAGDQDQRWTRSMPRASSWERSCSATPAPDTFDFAGLTVGVGVTRIPRM